MTCREALFEAAGKLAAAGRENCQRTARLLLEDALGLPAASFLLAPDMQLNAKSLIAYQTMIQRAAGGEPVQYILGRWDFYGRAFLCDRRALIPRPETERLVEAALGTMPAGLPCAVIDAGCGTGCVGITLKLERPEAAVTLCDISAGALCLAGENAALLGADVRIIEADMRRSFPGGPYDVIASNPPYVTTKEMAALPLEVRGYEPELALRGGRDGLELIRALAERAVDSLKPGGRVFIEVGYGQAEKVAELFATQAMTVDVIPDYAGIPRVVAARKGP